MVRFSGLFAASGAALAPIERVEIFQAIPAQQVSGRLREQYVPGVYVQRDKQPQAGAPAAMAPCHIVGNLIGLSGGGMMVQAGKASLRVPLAENAKFELRFNNLSLAQEGDPVSVAGFYQPPDETKVKADRITITTDRVFGEPVETPNRRVSRARRGRTAEKPAETTPEDEPAAAEDDPPAEDEAAAGESSAETDP
jgi:hypothetical protein